MRIEEKIAKVFTQKKIRLSIAESCTGGLISDRLTNISGSSSFFWLGVIAYDNKAKEKLLKIPSRLLKKHGAVSAPTAELMAQNVRGILKTDLGLSITGIAGPTGATSAKPIGLVFISLASKQGLISKKFLFKGSRLSIKCQAAQQALEMLLESGLKK